MQGASKFQIEAVFLGSLHKARHILAPTCQSADMQTEILLFGIVYFGNNICPQRYRHNMNLRCIHSKSMHDYILFKFRASQEEVNLVSNGIYFMQRLDEAAFVPPQIFAAQLKLPERLVPVNNGGTDHLQFGIFLIRVHHLGHEDTLSENKDIIQGIIFKQFPVVQEVHLMSQKFQTFFPKSSLYGYACMISESHMRQCYTYFHKFNFLLPIIIGAYLLIGFIKRLQTDMDIMIIRGIITILMSNPAMAIILLTMGFNKHSTL